MKAILEFEAPESCGGCVLSYHYKNRNTKRNEAVCVPKNLACEEYSDSDTRAPFCPLKIVEEESV